jgi:hypothetical protein
MRHVCSSQGHPLARSHWRTTKLPFPAAPEQAVSSQGQPLAWHHWSMSKLPLQAACFVVCESQGYPLARSHCRTWTWPQAAAAQVVVSHAHQFSRNHCTTCKWPRNAARSKDSSVGRQSCGVAQLHWRTSSQPQNKAMVWPNLSGVILVRLDLSEPNLLCCGAASATNSAAPGTPSFPINSIADVWHSGYKRRQMARTRRQVPAMRRYCLSPTKENTCCRMPSSATAVKKLGTLLSALRWLTEFVVAAATGGALGRPLGRPLLLVGTETGTALRRGEERGAMVQETKESFGEASKMEYALVLPSLAGREHNTRKCQKRYKV